MALKRGKNRKRRETVSILDYQAVMMRIGGACEAQLPGICTGRGQEWHHRQRRRDGHNRPSNGCCICSACHHHVTHVSPAVGRERGVVVSAYADDPGAVPMLTDGRWWLLDDDGGRTEVAE